MFTYDSANLTHPVEKSEKSPNQEINEHSLSNPDTRMLMELRCERQMLVNCISLVHNILSQPTCV